MPPINNAVDKFAGAINAQIIRTGMINGRNPFLKSLITFCLRLKLPAHIHKQRKLCQIRCLKGHIDYWQFYPPVCFINVASKF